MPKLKDKITVSVTENNSDITKRRITVQIEAAASLLTVSDLLSREEALEPLSQQLKRKTKAVLTDYIQSGKALLKSAAVSAVASASEPAKAPKKPITQ